MISLEIIMAIASSCFLMIDGNILKNSINEKKYKKAN